jgi:hypothetical protein
MKTATPKRFVKSASTSTPVSASQRELERILRRYGATDMALGSNWEQRVVRVSFRVPDSPGSKVIVPIRLEVSIAAVAEALGFTRGRYSWSTPVKPSQHGWEQAERVAWRHLVLWVDAAAAAVSAGMQTMSEAFLAHMLVKAPDGSVKKVSGLLDEVAGEGGYRALLPPATA